MGPGHYREAYGRWHEELVVGEVYEHRPGPTVSESDDVWLTLLSCRRRGGSAVTASSRSMAYS